MYLTEQDKQTLKKVLDELDSVREDSISEYQHEGLISHRQFLSDLIDSECVYYAI